MKAEQSVEAFFELIKAGLWGGGNTDLRVCGAPDWSKVYRLAQDQSVVGLVAAGIESVRDLKVPKAEALNFAVYTMQMEQRNKAMNEFVAGLIERLRGEGLNVVLVKGQGIAQCYDRPLWRASGDVDLLMDASDYEKAKKLLIPMATDVETEYSFFKHVGMTLNGWLVELHGTLQTRLSRRIDRVIDDVQADTFRNRRYRVWNYGITDSRNYGVADLRDGNVEIFFAVCR